jgi:oxygen-independent coproporphyrinogen-3 oxidase
MSRFGLYVHIPYCLQICTYCDFVKFEARDLPPADDYVALLEEELATRTSAFRDSLWPSTTPVDSIYFGGGTPSLFSPHQILTILKAIAKNGFDYAGRKTEITLEINPGTLSARSLREFQAIGINRFSVGAQTFDERFLKVTGRKHSVKETLDTLDLLAGKGINYSFDLLFGLPGQSVKDVREDVLKALGFEPAHLSAYNLTLPPAHPLNKGRASDERQAEMFQIIEAELNTAGVACYEVSNFARPGFESQHNLLYWTDGAYWGLGIGSHSYLPNWATPHSQWGARFWNPASIAAYRREIQTARGIQFWNLLPEARREILKLHELLTDFCHTSLRRVAGLSYRSIVEKFGEPIAATLIQEFHCRLAPHCEAGLVRQLGPKDPPEEGGWQLTIRGRTLADRVFESLTFLEGDKLSLPEV